MYQSDSKNKAFVLYNNSFIATYLACNERMFLLKEGLQPVSHPRGTHFTSPGSMPNSSLKHLEKYEGVEKPTS